MSTLIRVEWMKPRSTRAPWFLWLRAVAIVFASVAGVGKTASLALAGTAANGASHVGLVSLLSLTLGIMAVAGECRHQTISDAYLSTPRRTRVIAAKLTVSAAMGLLYGVVAAITGQVPLVGVIRTSSPSR